MKEPRNNPAVLPLPSDLTVERTVAAALLISPRLLTDCWAFLASGEVFTSAAYRSLVTAVNALHSEGRVVRLSSVVKHLKAEGSYAHLQTENVSFEQLEKDGLVTSDCITNCLYLRELWIRRQGAVGVEELRKRVYSQTFAVDELTDYAAVLADSLSAGMSIAKVKPLGHYIKKAIGQVEAAMQKTAGITGVPTGSDILNRHFGGWQKGVIMIAGRPGMGKTVVGLAAALASARAGVPTAYFSLEVSGEDLVMRAMAEAALIPYEDIMRGRLSAANFATLHHIIGELEQLPVYIYDEEARDIADIRNAVIDLVRTHKVGLVVIDYAQLIEDKTAKGKEYEEQTSISKKLKKLQRRVNIPLIELAQLSRDVEKRSGNRRPNKADLRSTGQYEQDASVVILLYRDDYYKLERAKESGREEPPDFEIEFIVDKNRNGKTGVAVLHIDVATNRLLDHPPGQPKVEAVPTGYEGWQPDRFPENIDVNF